MRKLLETTGTLWVQCLYNLTLSSREKCKGGRRKGKRDREVLGEEAGLERAGREEKAETCFPKVLQGPLHSIKARP